MVPSAPMDYLLARMRSSVADPELFDDDHIVRYLSDGYVAACERARLLRAWVTIPLISGNQEYALPSDWLQTIGVYQDGQAMDELSPRIAPAASFGLYYYSYDGVIGLVSVPTVSTDALWLHYARSPVALTAASVPELQFGPEWYRLMVCYAKWHVLRLGYGEEKLAEANRQRALYDMGVAQLERFSVSQNEAGSNSLPVTHVLEIAQINAQLATSGP